MAIRHNAILKPCVAAPAFPPTSARSRLRHSAGAADPEFRRQLERGADRSAAVARYDAKNHQRSLEVMRWGLVPFWAKDIKVGFANINAKAEGIENKPAFREALASTPNSSKYRKANKENRHVSSVGS